jgi:hypothetical protein
VIQCSGRPAHLAATHIYVKKGCLVEASQYADANANDPRLLKDSKSVDVTSSSVAFGKGHEEDELVDDGPEAWCSARLSVYHPCSNTLTLAFTVFPSCKDFKTILELVADLLTWPRFSMVKGLSKTQ